MLPLLLLLACSTSIELPEALSPSSDPGADDAKTAPPEVGKWGKARTDEFASLSAALEAIGYVDGDAKERTEHGITLHDPARAWAGRTVLNSGNRSEAELIDMEGNVLHRWCAPFRLTFPKVHKGLSNKISGPGVNHWRRVLALDDGSLLAIHEGRGLVKLGVDSSVLWSVANGAHHDLMRLDDTRLAVLSRQPERVESMHASKPVLTDYIEILDLQTGERLDRINILAALLASRHSKKLTRADKTWGDVTHTNTLRYIASPADTVIGHDAPVWLLSSRQLSAVFALDAATHELVWFFKKDFKQQHDADILRDGRLVMFDNNGAGKDSRVSIYGGDPLAIQWGIVGTDEAPLRSATLGTVRELPNGNLLISESQFGRAFEVDTETKDTVWQFTSSHRAGPNEEYVAVLFEARRFPTTFGEGWALGDVVPPECSGDHGKHEPDGAKEE